MLGAFLGTVAITAACADLPAMHRGFNTFPWLYRVATIGGDPQRFDYAHPFPYLDRFSAAGFRTLRSAGADLMRIPVEPTPLVVAGAEDRATLIRTILTAARRVTAAGMTAIIDLHPHEGVKGWGSADIIGSEERWQAYAAAVTDLASAMVATGDRRLVLELMNEPQGGYGGKEGRYWIYLQPELLKAVRSVAPALPVVVSGDRGGGIEGLLRLDTPKLDDPAVIYSFHYYEPMVVTHQGATWGSQSYRRYLNGVAYPPDPAQMPTVVSTLEQRVGSDAARVGTDAGKVLAAGTDALQSYYASGQGADRVRADFGRVSAWAKRSGVPNSRILLGEFGVYRPAASEDTAVRWTHDVRGAAEQAGFSWSYWNYAPFDENGAGFSVLQMRAPTPNALDAPILSGGLGLKVP